MADSNPRPTRSLLLKSALSYAERGIPVFPLHSVDAAGRCSCGDENCDSRGKHPRVAGSFKAATTDPRKIHMWWSRWPNANIGIPTGKASGIISVDLDVYKAGAWNQGDAEREKGPLPDTATIATGRGGVQLWYRHPEGEELPGSPENTIGPGFCVKSGGGYVVAPPSATTGRYRAVLKMDPSGLPAWLIEELAKAAPPRRREGGQQQQRASEEGEPIPEGSRNATLFFIALRAKDSGKAHGEVLATVLAANDARCAPPLQEPEVEAIVKSAMRYPVRGRRTPPEVLKLVESLERAWWGTAWRGVGGKTERDVVRVLIALARRYGVLVHDGVRITISVRDLALAAACGYVTVSRVLGRLRERGVLRDDNAERRGTNAGSWVLVSPRPTDNTQGISFECSSVITSARSLADLETPCFRWSGLVKKGRAGVLYALEASGPLTDEELAGRLGWGRVRDLVTRYISPLCEIGLVEDRGGVYALYDDHRERVDGVRAAPVERKVRRKTPEGRVVTFVEEGPSEIERETMDRKRYEKQRQKFRDELDRRRGHHDATNSPEELLEVPKNLVPVVADGLISELEPAGEEPPNPGDRIRSVQEVFDIAKSFFGKGVAA